MGNPTTQVDRWRQYRSYFWFGLLLFCAAFMLLWRSEQTAMQAYNARDKAVIAQRKAAVEAMRDKLKDLLAPGQPPASPALIEQRLNLPATPRWVEHSKSMPGLDKDNVEKRYYVDAKTGAAFGIRYLDGGYFDIPNGDQPGADGEPWGWWILQLDELEIVALWLLVVVYFFLFSWSRRVVAEIMLAGPLLYLVLAICNRHSTDLLAITCVSAMLAGSFLLLWMSYKVPMFNPRLCQTCGFDLTGLSVGKPCPGCGTMAGGHHAQFHEALKERVARGLEEDELPPEETPAEESDAATEENDPNSQTAPHDEDPQDPAA